MLMLHGRGASAEDILSLANEFDQPGFAYLAPQAAGNTWYPNRFLVPLAENEPWLSSALAFIADVLAEIINGAAFPVKRSYYLAFHRRLPDCGICRSKCTTLWRGCGLSGALIKCKIRRVIIPALLGRDAGLPGMQ